MTLTTLRLQSRLLSNRWAMKRIIKYDNLMNAVNQQKIEELCKTISENCDKPMGWELLTKMSGFSHKELIGLFQIYKQTTPMAFIKSARKLMKVQEPIFPQNQLFPKFIQSHKDWYESRCRSWGWVDQIIYFCTLLWSGSFWSRNNRQGSRQEEP